MKLIKRNEKKDVISTLLLNDSAFWGADVFVGVIFALFITQTLNGTAIDVGLMFGLYRITRAIAAVPVGRILDRHRGHIDEYYAVIAASGLVSLSYVLISFSTELWHVYFFMVFLGIGHVVDNVSWKVLFYGNLQEESQGSIMGIYEVTSQFTNALAMVAAGFIGEIFGYQWALIFAATMTATGALTLLTMYKSRSRF